MSDIHQIKSGLANTKKIGRERKEIDDDMRIKRKLEKMHRSDPINIPRSDPINIPRKILNFD